MESDSVCLAEDIYFVVGPGHFFLSHNRRSGLISFRCVFT